MIVQILSMGHPVMMIWMVLAPFCVVMALYTYNFSGRATTAYYTFPITKRQLFWTNFAAGSALMIVPLLILCLFLRFPIFYTYVPEPVNVYSGSWRSNVLLPSTLFPNGLEHGQVINSAWRMMTFFGRNVIGLMFFYAVFLLAVSIAGNKVVSVLLCAALPFVPLAVYGLINGMSIFYVFGIHWEVLSGGLGRTVEYTLPVGAWYAVIGGNATHGQNIWMYSIIYSVIAAAVFALAYMCSRMRRHERTGESVVFGKFKNVMVFVLSMGGMVVMGAFMYAMFNGRVWWYIGFALGFALMFFVGQMIAEKTLNIRHKLKLLLPFGGVMIGAYLIVVLIMTVGMRPYVNRVPDTARVEAVSLSNDRIWGRRSSFMYDAEAIARITEIHREILDNRRYLRRAANSTRFDNNTGRLFGSMFPIIYRMDDGSYVMRNYFLTNEFARRVGIQELHDSPAFRIASHFGLQNPEYVRNITFEFRGDTRSMAFVHAGSRPDVIQTVLDAVSAEYYAYLNDSRRFGRGWVSVSVTIAVEHGNNSWDDWISFMMPADGELMQLLEGLEVVVVMPSM